MFRKIFICMIGFCMAVGCSHKEDTQKKSVIILLGAPGSGKGTQAQEIARNEKLPHISTGDLFRENIRLQTSLGKEAQQYTNSGKLVPDQLVFDMLFDRISKEDCKNGYILDGFPRTKAQAEVLVERLGKIKPTVINLKISDEEVIKRLSSRLSCKQCGKIYNILFSPPKTAMKCDVCAGDLFQRPDDTEAVIKERLSVYHTQTAPVDTFFRERNLLVDIDATQAPAAILKEIQTVLQKEKVTK